MYEHSGTSVLSIILSTILVIVFFIAIFVGAGCSMSAFWSKHLDRPIASIKMLN